MKECEYCHKKESADWQNFIQLKQTPEGLLCQNCRDANIEDKKLYGAPMHVCKAISDARGKANTENLQMMGVAWGQRQTGLERLANARPCSIGNYHDEIRCENMAQWSYNGYPLCQDHLKQMADMNSDNYEAVKLALEVASEQA